MLPERCVCGFAVRRDTAVRVVIYRHWKEGLKSANSARLASLVLPNVEIRSVGRPDPRLHPAAGTREFVDVPTDITPSEIDPSLLTPGTRLIYPPDERDSVPDPGGAVTTLVIPDGTWGQTRRLVRRVPGLTSLPRLVISPTPRVGPRVLTPPAEWACSTLEAIGHAFTAIGDPDTGAALVDLYNHFADHMRWETRPREDEDED